MVKKEQLYVHHTTQSHFLSSLFRLHEFVITAGKVSGTERLVPDKADVSELTQFEGDDI